MNYTKKYHLPQWEEEDRILRSDFNQAMANIETAMLEGPYSIGQYYGTGKRLTISLGFEPRMMFITEVHDGTDSSAGICGTIGMYGRTAADDPQVTLTQNGFTLNSKHQYPSVNQPGKRYYFIAFQ